MHFGICPRRRQSHCKQNRLQQCGVADASPPIESFVRLSRAHRSMGRGKENSMRRFSEQRKESRAQQTRQNHPRQKLFAILCPRPPFQKVSEAFAGCFYIAVQSRQTIAGKTAPSHPMPYRVPQPKGNSNAAYARQSSKKSATVNNVP